MRDDALWSLRRMINWDIIYSDGRLRVRPGSERWNDSPLAAPADQLFYWIDRDQNENLLALLGSGTDRWYVAKASGAHILLRDEAATARCMVVDLGDRLVFATDTGLYWTDNASIPTVTPSYRLGIKKPAATGAQVYAVDGNYAGVEGIGGVGGSLNTTNNRKLGAGFTPVRDQKVSFIRIRTRWYLNPTITGAIRGLVYTADGAGFPDVLVTDATSDWRQLTLIAPGLEADVDLQFDTRFSLSAGVPYVFVVEGDPDYYANFHPVNFYVEFRYTLVAGGITCDQFDTWSAQPQKLKFWVGSIREGSAPAPNNMYFDYVMTQFNSQYGIESRPSDNQRIRLSGGASGGRLTFAVATDPQVDKIRAYRRRVGETIPPDESLITDTYKLVCEVDSTQTDFVDTVKDSLLGGQLQTQDHYCYDDTEPGDDSTRPEALVPGPGCYWNGRIWMAEPHGAVLYFTKKLTKRGGTGIVGDSEPDFFPLNNKLELPVSSDVIAAQPIGDQQLGVYFRDESVWVIWGAADPLNPPADIMQRKILSDNGLIGAGAISEMLGRHVYLSRDGLHSYGGSQPPLYGVSSETNQTILDDIEDQYLRASVIAVFGPEIWMLVDRDNDGDLDTVMILDLQRELPSREIMDRAWRMYEYSEALNDLVVKPTATTFRVMLAACAGTNYILELGIATRTDLGSAIPWEVESHDMRGDEMAFAYELSIQAKYPGTPPIWRVTVTDHGDRTVVYTLEPTSSMDIREHRTGLRMNSPVSVRVKLTGSSVEADELRSLAVGYKGE